MCVCVYVLSCIGRESVLSIVSNEVYNGKLYAQFIHYAKLQNILLGQNFSDVQQWTNRIFVLLPLVCIRIRGKIVIIFSVHFSLSLLRIEIERKQMMEWVDKKEEPNDICTQNRNGLLMLEELYGINSTASIEKASKWFGTTGYVDIMAVLCKPLIVNGTNGKEFCQQP